MSIAVIGAGVVGLATTSELLARGMDVTCFERGAPMGERSVGESRIFRYAHQVPDLVEAARHARLLFGDWEKAAGQDLIEAVGTVVSGDDVHGWADAMTEAGAEHFLVGPGSAQLRLPTSITAQHSLIDPAGGVIRVDRIRELLTDRCRDAIRSEHVHGLEAGPEGVTVHTSHSSHRYDQVVLAAGAATGPLAAQVGLYTPLALHHHARFTFPLRATAPIGPPAWITTSASGLPTYQHSSTPGHWAVGLELGPEAIGWTVGRDAALAALEAATLDYVRAELELVEPRIVDRVYCTPYDGLADGIHYRRRGGVLAVYGENLMKFAPLIGRDCADAVINVSIPSSLGHAQ
ncbi:hypothetical protein GCM10022223_70240 [Kineosporia mesophila]|uniref:FAD dependent oxidoreductase domain-containing protein n=1 Tax=Kineosporia mesophila TaxID=566012 RepID=A0ABP7AUR0_9ACTN|nr:FAD-dependent oxidoreductase [Kineosporia mesophila]MCD5354141.1 FAD-binding oxidoreductase [Kineosporia mesophila]